MRPFIPERPSDLFIKTAQEVVHAQLASQNKLHIAASDLERLKNLPPDAGIILTPNHADETDPRLVLEISRRTGRRFISMCNREAFDEMLGLAGFVLQRLGHFSVERGAHDKPAKDHAVDVVAGGQALVIFPEGEIFYLNEKIQPLHSGAVEIGMQALLQKRKKVYMVPMAIKYHYPDCIDTLLMRRITRLENHLLITPGQGSAAERLRRVQATLLEREATKHHLSAQDGDEPGEQSEDAAILKLQERITAFEKALIADVQSRHENLTSYQKDTIDRAWQLEAELREAIAQEKVAAERQNLESDLAALQEVAQLVSWRPQYYAEGSEDRLAEALLKVERELYRIKRPKQLTTRDVYVSLAEPVDLSDYLEEYERDARAVRHDLTAKLQAQLQNMLDSIMSGLGRH